MEISSFNWVDYLILANTLSANVDEASQRTAISRAYYFAFHAATTRAHANGYNGQSHGRLWKMYQEDTDLNSRRLAVIGNQMKQAREDADYVAQVARVNDVMTSQLERATRFASILAQVPAGSPHPLPPNPPKLCRHCGSANP